jgi:hypothetical protein
MIQIPYDAIGLGIAVIFMVLAFLESEATGRIIIVAVFFVSFLLPTVFPSSTMTVICSVGRLLFGAGCFIFWRYRTAIH